MRQVDNLLRPVGVQLLHNVAVDELHCPHPSVEDEGDGDTVGDLGDVIDTDIHVTVVMRSCHVSSRY